MSSYSLVTGGTGTLWLVSRSVQSEDEPLVAGPEGAMELRAVADIAAPGEQGAAQSDLLALPGRQRGRHIPAG